MGGLFVSPTACVLEFLAARLVAAELHEHAHAVVARLLGHKPEVHYRMCVVPDGLAWRDGFLVQHSGWLASVLLSIAATTLGASHASAFACWLVAAEALSSDLLGVGPHASGGSTFFCGNFGLLLPRSRRRPRRRRARRRRCRASSS